MSLEGPLCHHINICVMWEGPEGSPASWLLAVGAVTWFLVLYVEGTDTLWSCALM